MFAMRHTQSVLSDETIEPHLLAAKEQQTISSVIVEEVPGESDLMLATQETHQANEPSDLGYDMGTLQSVQVDEAVAEDGKL